MARLAKSKRFFFGSTLVDFDTDAVVTWRSSAKFMVCGGGVMLPIEEALLPSGVCGGVSIPGLVMRLDDSDTDDGDGIM